MKQTKWLSEFSCLSEYTRLYPTLHWILLQNQSVTRSMALNLERLPVDIKKKVCYFHLLFFPQKQRITKKLTASSNRDCPGQLRGIRPRICIEGLLYQRDADVTEKNASTMTSVLAAKQIALNVAINEFIMLSLNLLLQKHKLHSFC